MTENQPGHARDLRFAAEVGKSLEAAEQIGDGQHVTRRRAVKLLYVALDEVEPTPVVPAPVCLPRSPHLRQQEPDRRQTLDPASAVVQEDIRERVVEARQLLPGDEGHFGRGPTLGDSALAIGQGRRPVVARGIDPAGVGRWRDRGGGGHATSPRVGRRRAWRRGDRRTAPSWPGGLRRRGGCTAPWSARRGARRRRRSRAVSSRPAPGA